MAGGSRCVETRRMKALTTMLAERAIAKMEQPADGLKEWRDAAQAQITELVIDACLFTRPTSYAGNALASHSGPVVGMLLRKSREIRAGGLPQHFVLAVTDREVVVLERVMTARGGPLGRPGGEVVRWKRSEVGVSYGIAGYLLKVTLVVRGEVFECTVVKHDLTESFLRLLGDPENMRAAA
jgi:hypothetical protein